MVDSTAETTLSYTVDEIKKESPTSILFISHELYLFIMSISLGILCQVIDVFGMITNILNIIIFIKQGFSEIINISLLALSLSDLFSLLTIMWSNICYSPNFQDVAISFDPDEFQLITGGWPHWIFTRTTGWITAFISFERCMCVIFPLKVKSIFNKRGHLKTMIIIFAATLGGSFIAYVEFGLGWKYFPERNATLVGVVYNLDSYGQIVTNSVTYAVYGVFMPVSSFLTVVICTFALTVKLKQNAKWRTSNLSVVNQMKRSGKMKNQRVAKMVVMLSAIFIASYIPAVIIFIAGCVEPQLSFFGIYKHIFMITMSTSFTCEVINSSINIFVYITMSSKYKRTLQSFLKLNTPSKS